MTRFLDARRSVAFTQRICEEAGKLAQGGRVAQMERYVQHGRVSTLEHSLRVAAKVVCWSRRLDLCVAEGELVRGAILHDYYLHDWHEPNHAKHATAHPLIALENAGEDFMLTDRERNIISTHMWPLPPTRIPVFREAWLVCLADKRCSLEETLFMR